MALLAFFFLLTLQPHGYGQPTGVSQAPGTRGRVSEAGEPLVNPTKKSFLEEDDYEPYETPTPEVMDGDNFTALSLVMTIGMQQGVTNAPVTIDLGEPTTHEATRGKLTTEELTTEAPDRRTTNPPLPEEPTSGLPSTGHQTTRDLTTEKVVTDVTEMEESASKVPSPGQQVIYNSTPGDVNTDTVAVSITGKSATDPLATVTLALDTNKAETVTPTMGPLVTYSATTMGLPTSLPAELKPNHSSPASSLNASASFVITLHPLHNSSLTFSPASSSNAPSDPPKPEVATRQIDLPNATTAHLFISDQIPVRQCLLAVLILALVATIFLICTVVLAIRLSKKGHTYPVRDYSPTEMVCISSLLAEGEGPPMTNGGPVSAKTQLLKPTPGPGEDCDGDDLTLHSFLP
ncbi:P-selectin glycoprotein ligand 1 [Petaurus breviceps papuanus]|uniref:P-selectin glycoprotein ligand 1 n=1 Tax=Petaurus breviceps papuanus TaxID=3040969 RepID=UPI0036DE0CC7